MRSNLKLSMYFDSAYVAKCYLHEPDSLSVQLQAARFPTVQASELLIAEMATIFHRQLRERKARPEQIDRARELFRADLRAGTWRLHAVSRVILDIVADVIDHHPSHLLIRASDAIHLATARHLGLTEVWTNDRRMLEAAPLSASPAAPCS